VDSFVPRQTQPLCAVTTPTSKRVGLALWVHHFGFPFTSKLMRMNRPFDRKLQKSLKSLPPSQQAILLGINVAAGPLGLRAELDVHPNGE